jgi:hypothetical protein
MKKPLFLLLLFAACGGETATETEEPPTPAPKLVLTLEGGKRERDGRYRLKLPLREDIPLALRLANEGDAPVQVCRSSFPFYYFFKLEIVRLGEGGARTPVPAYWDLYPTKDMRMPSKEYVTLGPGDAIARDLDTLLREGYLLETFHATDVFDHYEELRGQGFGALREPGDYEVVGVYRVQASDLDGTEHDRFQGETGRDEEVPLWAGGPVRTKSLRVTVVEAW